MTPEEKTHKYRDYLASSLQMNIKYSRSEILLDTVLGLGGILIALLPPYNGMWVDMIIMLWGIWMSFMAWAEYKNYKLLKAAYVLTCVGDIFDSKDVDPIHGFKVNTSDE